MQGFRDWLVLMANWMLVLLIAAAPVAAFFVAANAYGTYRGLNAEAGAAAALVTFLAALPTAAFLAVFLDIREQLVALNNSVRNRDERAVRERALAPSAGDVRDARGLTDLSNY